MTSPFTVLQPFLTHYDHVRWIAQSGQHGIDQRALPSFLDALDIEVGDADGKAVITNIFRHELTSMFESIRCEEMLYRFSPHLSSILKVRSKDESEHGATPGDTTIWEVTHIQSGTVMYGLDVCEQADILVEFLVRECPADFVMITRDWLMRHPLRSLYVQVDAACLLQTIDDWIVAQLPPDGEEPLSCA